jgi:hypothetical protein
MHQQNAENSFENSSCDDEDSCCFDEKKPMEPSMSRLIESRLESSIMNNNKNQKVVQSREMQDYRQLID